VPVNSILNLPPSPHPLGHSTSSSHVSLSSPMVLCTSGISTWFDCPYTPQYALYMRSICQYSSSSSSKLAYIGLQAIATYSIYCRFFLRNIFSTFLYHQSTSCIVCVVCVILQQLRTCLVFQILHA
jgi:hypothetical protein